MRKKKPESYVKKEVTWDCEKNRRLANKMLWLMEKINWGKNENKWTRKRNRKYFKQYW